MDTRPPHWSVGNAQGGVTIDYDGYQQAMILVPQHCAYSTARKRAQKMVKLLNAGELAGGR